MTSASPNRRIARNTLALYLRMAFVMVVQLYTSRVILDKLGENAYGLYNVIGGLVVVMTFINGAMVATTQRFLSFELGRNDFDKLKLTFSQSLYAHILIAVVFVIIAETLGLWFLYSKMVFPADLRTQAFWVFQFSVSSFVISLLQTPFGALITAHERLDVYALLGMVEVCLKLAVAFLIGCISFSIRLGYYAFFVFIVSVMINMAYIGFCRIKYKETRLVPRIDFGIFKELSSFFGWSVFGSLAWLGKNQGVNIVLNTFLGTAVNAAYGIAMQINGAISSFAQNFITSVNPQLIQSYARQDYDRTNMLIIKGAKVSFLLLFLVVFPVIISLNEILSLWLVNVPEYTVVFARLVLIVTLLESFTYIMGTAIQATGKIKIYQLVIGLTLLANLPVSYILLRLEYPSYYVLYGSVAIAFVALVEREIIMRKLVVGFSPAAFYRKVILKCFGVAALSDGLYNCFECVSPDVNWICRAMVAVLLAAICCFTIGMDKIERDKIYSIIKNGLRFKIWTK